MIDPASIDKTIDTRGSLCPEPVTRTRRALDTMTGGQLLSVLATDPLAELDLRVFCERHGHELLEIRRSPPDLEIVIRKGPP